ncbi:hypothetical protein Tco_1115477, partial [Tanacetum coccineum]
RRSARLHNQMAKHDGGSDELIDLTGGQADVVSDLVIQGIVAEIQAKHRKTVSNDRDVWKKESQKRSKYYIVAEKQCGDDKGFVEEGVVKKISQKCKKAVVDEETGGVKKYGDDGLVEVSLL